MGREKSHSHGGHRARLRARYFSEGLNDFEPHEVLELLLFTTIPQRDVNPLAHALIERFGSVGGVLHAPREQVTSVPGMGECSADFLALMGEAADRYRRAALDDRPCLEKLKSVEAHCRTLFDAGDEEQMWVFSMDAAGHLLGSTLVMTGDWRNKLTLRRAIEPVLRYHAQSAVLVQKRRPGNLALRPDDLSFTLNVAEQLNPLRIRLMDSLLMAGRTTFSLRKAHLYTLAGESGAMGDSLNLFEHWLDET
ncbi:MAG: JAB domain-containing protein [Clostridia bacterium]